MSKGSNPRTWNTPEFESNYEKIFGKKEPWYARKKSEDVKTDSGDNPGTDEPPVQAGTDDKAGV